MVGEDRRMGSNYISALIFKKGPWRIFSISFSLVCVHNETPASQEGCQLSPGAQMTIILLLNFSVSRTMRE